MVILCSRKISWTNSDLSWFSWGQATICQGEVERKQGSLGSTRKEEGCSIWVAMAS